MRERDEMKKQELLPDPLVEATQEVTDQPLSETSEAENEILLESCDPHEHSVSVFYLVL